MSIPNVDTFEHDISEEIKNKEASISDIASASGDLGNTQQTRGGSNLFFILGGLFIFVVLCVLGALLYFTARGATPQPTATQVLPVTSTTLLFNLSPTLADAIEGNISNVTKSDYGYKILLSSYTSVFSYMIKNENAYADEIAVSLGEPRDTSTTTPPFSFTDVTINNQNMRVGTSSSSTIVYAFVNAQALLVATSTQGILSLTSDIIN